MSFILSYCLLSLFIENHSIAVPIFLLITLTKSPQRLQERFRNTIYQHHYSIHTEQTDWHWIKRFLYFHHRQPPNKLAAGDIEYFLTHLAVERQVAPATQNIAFNALMFLS